MRHSKRNHGTNTARLPYLWDPDCCPNGLFAFVWKISKTYPHKLSCEKAQKSTLLLEHNAFVSSQHCSLWTNNTFENKHLQLLTSHIAISVCDQQGLLTPELLGLLGMSQWLEITGCFFSREGRENWWQWVGKQGPIPGQQFSDEHTPPSQSKTFHCILLGPKESNQTFSMAHLGKKQRLYQQAQKQKELVRQLI